MKRLWVAAALGAFSIGCGRASDGGPDPEPDPTAEEHPAVVEARNEFPRFIDLHAKVISTTCSPNPGVCHNSSNYPNLETAGNTLTWIDAPCNTEIPNPLDGWDGCEQQGHVVVASLPDGSAFRSAIAWMIHRTDGVWDIRLEDPAPETVLADVKFEAPDGAIFYDPTLVAPVDSDDTISVTIDLAAAASDAVVTVTVTDITDRIIADSILATLRGGDPNQNGVYGAGSGGAEILPGDLSKSYLWGRITGTVPGSRMPLANGPLTLPEYVAIACWIEALDETPEPEDAIGYDDCAFAREPVDYTMQ